MVTCSLPLLKDESKQVTAFSSNKKLTRTKQIPVKNTDENDMRLWLKDKGLSLFFKNEINIINRKPEEALLTANEKGLYQTRGYIVKF
jgi:hypothetical protein